MKNEKNNLEDSLQENINWGKLFDINCASTFLCDAIPVVVQDFKTKEVLMLAYANPEALEQTFKTGLATFWSTSRQKPWLKGETSGNYLQVKEVRINCEQNSLLYLVDPEKNIGACHVRDKNNNYRRSCFYRKIENNSLTFID
jgi:phosphoribosyl-AMP cyclohydrolase